MCKMKYEQMKEREGESCSLQRVASQDPVLSAFIFA